MRRISSLALVLTLASVSMAACGGSPQAKAPGALESTQAVFDAVVPSVVAVLNDDREDMELEKKMTMKELGLVPKAPKTIVDVSLRKERSPHGTGFMIEGGYIVTAAHVVFTPDRLLITTKAGRQVGAELVKIDEVRDIAILKPKVPLPEVPPLPLEPGEPQVGRKVWALGHTGGGMWALSWGVSEGIASGVVDLLGARVLLYDAAVYPGFSGGPVVHLDASGRPRVIGVNHAILFTGGMVTTGSISSASIVGDIRAVVAGTPHPMEKTLSDYVKARSAQPRAELFLTSGLSVHKDPSSLTTAAIFGNKKAVEAVDGVARVPVVAMLFGLKPGKHEITFDLEDPDDKVVKTIQKTVEVTDKERVGFASADFSFDPEFDGRYEIIAKVAGKELSRTNVWIEDPEDDDQSVDDEDLDDAEDGQPKVEVVVAALGKDNPLALLGIRSAWAEWKYPRRVEFTWFARGSRGWSGTNVAINAWVLDEKGAVVGRGVGCVRPELRPEFSWSCMGRGGEPLLNKAGRYDIVFTLNDKPVSVWPMEAVMRPDDPKSAFEKWAKDVKKKPTFKKPKGPKAPTESGKAVTPNASGLGHAGAAKAQAEGDKTAAEAKAKGIGKSGAAKEQAENKDAPKTPAPSSKTTPPPATKK